MISEQMYADYLSIQGNNLSEVRRYNSEMIANARFTGATSYQRVYILDPEVGWHYTDAQYHQHSRQDIAKDDVDYYMMFRPHEHHPIGTYVFIPGEDKTIGFKEESPVNPFYDNNFQEVFNKGKLWLIVDKNKSVEFIRYMAVPCDYLFKWVASYNGKKEIFQIYGANRLRESAKAGTWDRIISRRLDTVTYFWIPDTHFVFGEKKNLYGLDDSRYLAHDMRIMVTTNVINPKVYRVTDISEMDPQGIVKVTLKQDEYDMRTDNIELMVCNYYDNSGDVQIPENEGNIPDPNKTATIYWAVLNSDEQLERDTINASTNTLKLGVSSYFIIDTSDDVDFLDWRIEYSDNNADYTTLTEDEILHLNNLITISKLNETSVSVKAGKTKKLIGTKFYITAQTPEGDYKTKLEVEVSK